MKNCLAINECYSSNIGDQAIAQSLKEILREKNYKVNQFNISNPTKKKAKYDYQAVAKRNSVKQNAIKSFLAIPYYLLKHHNNIKEQISANDVFFIGGGQLINSSKTNQPSRFSYAIYIITQLITTYSTKKIIFIGIGCVSKFNALEKFFYKRALNKASNIIVRDEFSKNMILKNFNLNSEVMPDLAFYGNENIEKIIAQKKAIIFVTDSNVVKQYSPTEFHIQDYYNLLESKYNEYTKNGFLVSFGYTTMEDAIETREFIAYLENKTNTIYNYLHINNLQQLKSLLAETQLVFAGRMHALILGKKMGCKIEPHQLSEKLVHFTNEYLTRSYNDIKQELVEKIEMLNANNVI